MKVLKLKVKTVSLKVTVKNVFDGEAAYPGYFILRVGQGIPYWTKIRRTKLSKS